MRKIVILLLFTLIAGVFTKKTQAQARVQFVHNSPDLLLDSIDVYINKTLVLNDFKFRTASSFLDAYSGVNLLIDICDPTSTSPSNSLATFTTQFAPNSKYMIVASGVLSPDGYNPYKPFSLETYNLARENAVNPANTDLNIYHGSTDALTMDFWIPSFGILAEDLSYSEFSTYSGIPTADYTLEIKDSTGQFVIFNYELKLAEWGLTGLSGTLMASGFINPSSNNYGSPFGMYLALSTGGALIEVPAVHEPTAYLQIIHNSTDLGVSVVDVWVDNKIVANDLPFRHSIPYIELVGDASATISILPSNSTSPNNPLASLTATFADGMSYIVTTAGIHSSTGYNPAKPFELKKKDDTRQLASNPNNTDILFFHGSTDLESVNIQETGIGLGVMANALDYGTYQGYKSLLTADYVFKVTNASGNVDYGAFLVPLSQLGMQSKAITIVCSGFKNPENNSNGEKFGLYISRTAGGALVPLTPYIPPTSSDIQIVHASADTALAVCDIWVNDELLIDNLEFGKASPFHEVAAGTSITLSICPSNSTNASNPIISKSMNLLAGKRNMMVISGIKSSTGYEPKKDLILELKSNIRTLALNPANTDLIVYHASTDAPELDIYEFSTGVVLNDIGYGSFSNYAERTSFNGGLHLYNPEGVIIESYSAPFINMGYIGKAVTLLSTGFINTANNSNGAPFGFYVIPFTGGNFIPLQKVTGTIENQNDAIKVYPNPASQNLYIEAGAGHGKKIEIQINSSNGQKVYEGIFENASRIEIPVSHFAKGLYILRMTIDQKTSVRKISIQ